MPDPVYIIAEAGVNHNGSLERAIQLAMVASDAGANAVKFQTFNADKLVSRDTPKAEYQIVHTGANESQYEMLRKLELNQEAYIILFQKCKEFGIEFLSTPFDIESLIFLRNKVGLTKIKLSSGDITNAPLLLAVARSDSSVVLSTGMSTIPEITTALGILAFGYIDKTAHPSIGAFKEAYNTAQAQKILKDKVILLHCTTEYPTPFLDVNLHAMNTMKETFGLRVGYSDHTLGVAIPVAAVALGACMIEKHFTSDRNLPGPDHKASLEPRELKLMVRSIREVESALGSHLKTPTRSELKNRSVARKSIVAARAIRSGEAFSPENLTVKRAGDGTSPIRYWEILGKTADRDYQPDEKVQS